MPGDFGAYISAGTAGIIKIMLFVVPLFRIFNDGATVVLTFCIMVKAVRSCGEIYFAVVQLDCFRSFFTDIVSFALEVSVDLLYEYIVTVPGLSVVSLP